MLYFIKQKKTKLLILFTQDGTIGEDLVVKPVPASMEGRLRDHQEQQQRLWRSDEANRIHSERNNNNASRAHRREDDQELFVDYAFLGNGIFLFKVNFLGINISCYNLKHESIFAYNSYRLFFVFIALLKRGEQKEKIKFKNFRIFPENMKLQ